MSDEEDYFTLLKLAKKGARQFGKLSPQGGYRTWLCGDLHCQFQYGAFPQIMIYRRGTLVHNGDDCTEMLETLRRALILDELADV